MLILTCDKCRQCGGTRKQSKIYERKQGKQRRTAGTKSAGSNQTVPQNAYLCVYTCVIVCVHVVHKYIHTYGMQLKCALAALESA